MAELKNREYYISLLQKTAEELGRLPKKSDFDVEDMSRIKSFWGPWPHALAQAGLIDSHEDERINKNREKHSKAKALRRESD